MESVAVTFHMTAVVVRLLGPLALLLVALMLVRPRCHRGWLLMAVGAGLMLLSGVGGPLMHGLTTLRARQHDLDTLRQSLSVQASVELGVAIVGAVAFAFVILGVLRLCKAAQRR